ncbi:MAG: redoxin domain-containing protein [Pirellulaceae bacterium]|nr:redoxin domain-containing protein [Pirellulaceae bacterium]
MTRSPFALSPLFPFSLGLLAVLPLMLACQRTAPPAPADVSTPTPQTSEAEINQPPAAPEPEPVADDPRAVEQLERLEASLRRDEAGLVTSVGWNAGPARDVVPLLTGLPGLRHLSLAGSQVTAEDLEAVGGLDTLVELDLFDTQLGDPELAPLAGLPRLERLSLAGTRITDDGLKLLAQCRELRQLDLSWTKVSGSTLDALSQLAQLEQLDLSWTAVSDQHAERLAALTQLKLLSVVDSELTAKGVERLRERLATTEITARDAVRAAIQSGRADDYRLAGAGPGDLVRIAAGDYQTAWNEFLQRYASAEDQVAREEVATTAPSPRPVAERMLKLAEQHPEHPAAIEALTWVLRADESDVQDLQEAAIERLVEQYADNPLLGDGCLQLDADTSPAIQRLLRAVRESSTVEEIRAKATYALAGSLLALADDARQTQDLTELDRVRALHLRGTREVGRLLDIEIEPLRAEAETLLAGVVEQHAAVTSGETTLGELAGSQLFELRNLAIGQTAPEIAGQDMDGQPLQLSDQRGKIVMLTFWGNWCGPCRAMFPHEREIAERLKDEPFVMLGVNSDRDRDLARQVMVDENLTWRSWWDGGSTRGPIARAWNVERWPTIYLFDAQGVIRYKDVRGEELDAALDTLLAELKAAPGEDGK